MTSIPRRSSSSGVASTCDSSAWRPSVSTAGCSSSSSWSSIRPSARAAARRFWRSHASRYATRPSQLTPIARSSMARTIAGDGRTPRKRAVAATHRSFPAARTQCPGARHASPMNTAGTVDIAAPAATRASRFDAVGGDRGDRRGRPPGAGAPGRDPGVRDDRRGRARRRRRGARAAAVRRGPERARTRPCRGCRRPTSCPRCRWRCSPRSSVRQPRRSWCSAPGSCCCRRRCGTRSRACAGAPAGSRCSRCR